MQIIAYNDLLCPLFFVLREFLLNEQIFNTSYKRLMLKLKFNIVLFTNFTGAG